MTHKVAILGASGYTGAELIRLIDGHSNFDISVLAGERKAGQDIATVFPHLRHLELPIIQQIDEIDFSTIDLCFCALPHKTSQKVVTNLPHNLKIIDLSADFRLRDASEYQKWYGIEHHSQDLQKEAIYGLTEFYRNEIMSARLVAGTGCNAAVGQYILRPLVDQSVIDLSDIILDLKCGVSGAGRTLSTQLLHAELSEGAHAYAVGGNHRHLGEFDQELSQVAGQSIRVQLTTHLIPMNRGILATVYVIGDPKAIHKTLSCAYEQEHFIEILPLGETPSTHHVRGSNFVHIGVSADRISNKTIIVAVLDNLIKGSSGQALQNANLMFGEVETEGLMMSPLYP
ncbi:MAG: N-acetyl-gamma-glutamyl-phosphate reductase [Aestuariivita sp.]|nr:N-acetyl-gamma-glutamyl-phosphate reductase [Aestuariivita sp.]